MDSVWITSDRTNTNIQLVVIINVNLALDDTRSGGGETGLK